MKKNKELSIVIADDHPLYLSGVRNELEKESGIKIVAEAEEGETALSLILQLKPDIAILDIQMPKLSGLHIARKLKLNDQTKLILLTMFNDQKMFLQAMDYGVRGYVLKDAAVHDIVTAVFDVAEEKYYLSTSLSGLLVPGKQNRSVNVSALLTGLTPAELKILSLISTLKSNKEIADTLFISQRTVENHRVNISHKLNISGTNSLLKFAIKNKDLLPEV